MTNLQNHAIDKKMNIKPIKTDSDYQEALKEIENLMMAEADTPEGEKLDIMVTMVQIYEAKLFPLTPLQKKRLTSLAELSELDQEMGCY